MKYILLALLTSFVSLQAGTRFGFQAITFGNINSQYSAAGSGRSYEIAHSDSLQLNFKNPATWTTITRTTLSINSNYTAFFSENNIEKSYTNNSSFEGAYIGIPLFKRTLNFGLGLQPFTSINQKITTELDGPQEVVQQELLINGGLSKINFNLAYKINDNTSAGLGYEYTFGRIDEKVSFSENTTNLFNLNYEKRVRAGGLVLSLFSNAVPNLNLGLVVKPTLKGTFITAGSTVSVAANEEVEKKMSIPTEINFGAEYRMSESYYTGVDILYQGWKEGFKIANNKVDGYSNFYYFGVGLERKGSSRQFINYLDQLDFRTGVFYKNLAQTNEFKDVTEIGFSFGLTLPIQRFRSKIDLAGFISKRGDLKTNGLQETIVGMKFSISANELWFVNLED